MYIKDNGLMIKHMEKVYIIIMMAQVIQENGIKMYKKDMVSKNGLMAPIIKGINIYFIILLYRYHKNGLKQGKGKFVWTDFS